MITLFENFKFYKTGQPIAYSAIVLDKKSRELLLSKYIYPNPEYVDWIKICDHMTICLGELPEHIKMYWLNEEVTLTAFELGISDKSVAVKVTGFFNINKLNIDDGPLFQHITLAINPYDAKPKDSNYIENWQPISHLKINGVVKEINSIY